MADAEYMTATLPSRGILYGKIDGEPEIPGGKYEVRKLTSREDALIFQQGAPALDRINRVINSCVRLPNSFDPDNLLVTDRMAILLTLRIMSLGRKYKVPFKCQFCNQQSKYELDILEDLDEKTPPEDLEEPIDVDLPDEGIMVTLRFMRGTDESRVMKRANRLMMQSTDVQDQSYFHRIALLIVGIDGDTTKALGEREDFVRHLSLKDITTMRNAIDKHEPGIDLRVYPLCGHCGATNEMALPFTAEFFRPSDL